MSGRRPFSELKKSWSAERLAANAAHKAKLSQERRSADIRSATRTM